ncbi:hypothetical protein Q4Q35_02160 [Flavivirga aquimarina]|uniref:Uncharacterized protein n=1 Tax=Flavivirga aquimarina TaxID=2027862 RepID=A0ABT8W664_9FLAO|nr:hypothetical protein [Flavivirga aquimarina]MDO5968600.1 hypothetical protein [Flavivirga aquimarina]
MGWNITATFIKDIGDLEINLELLNSLGFKGFELIGESDFNIGPEFGETHITNYKGNLIIANASLGWQFAKPTQTKTEKKFLERFPNSEIIQVLIGHGLSYCVFQNGQKIRLREAGDEIYQDFGNPLLEEIEARKLELISKDDLEEMREELTKEEIQNEIELEVTYNTAFELTKRIFGKRYDELGIPEYNMRGLKFVNKAVASEKKYSIKSEMQFEK